MIPIYLDEKGYEISISQGIGGQQGNWYIFRKKNNGSLQRIKSISPIPFGRKDLAIKTLEAYAVKKKYLFKEKRESL